MPRSARRALIERERAAPIHGLDHDDPVMVRALARTAILEREAVERVRSDPWEWLTSSVNTLDEAGGTVRPFPARPYLQDVVRLWKQNQLLAIPKSRRMMLSWTMVACCTWLAAYTPNARVAMMARKLGRTEQEGSNGLVWRARFIMEQIPQRNPLLRPIETVYTTGRLSFPNGSEIIALGEGPDQARQMGFTAVLADEFGFWERAYETWIALKPTIQGGGKITLLSSAYPGTWDAIVHDVLPS